MKTTMILTVISLFLFNVKISAQTQEDSLAIAAACRNYVEGWAGGVKAPDQEPGKPYTPDIRICDITGDYALVKAVSAKYGFFDYCQLAKFNGEWQIINVLWGPLPQKK